MAPQPEALLPAPVNDLEAHEDPECLWRAYVNDACRAYAGLWALVDWWIYLEVPDMASVRRWRSDQERHLPPGAAHVQCRVDQISRPRTNG